LPSFTSKSPNLQAIGPVADIEIMPSQLMLQTIKPTSLPQPYKARALIDTGASGTVIQKGIAQTLGLSPVGVTFINTPSSQNVACYQYHIQFLFVPNNMIFEGIVTEASLQGQPIQCLIGRDILALAVFVYTGYDNSFTLAF